MRLSRWTFAILAVAGFSGVTIAADRTAPTQPAGKTTIPAKGQVQGNAQNGQSGQQGDNQNGQSEGQGEQQNGQAGEQGEKQNGQAGAQGNQQNSQAGDQGGSQNGQGNATSSSNARQ